MNLEQYNELVRKWGAETAAAQRAQLASIGARATGVLIKEFKVRYGMQFGAVNRVTFGFPRYLVFLEKGAGRGYGGRKGSKWWQKNPGKDVYGVWRPPSYRRTDPASLGRMGKPKRLARPTFNPLMGRRVPVLLEILADHWAQEAFKVIDVQIK